MDELAFRIGARGYLLKQLQQQLGVVCDGVYGPAMEAAVEAASLRLGVHEPGAGPRLFSGLSLPWPEEFERCLNLTSCLEGTSFGDCNAGDIDGAGLTMGVAGFTTQHGEVQELLARFMAVRTDSASLLSEKSAAQLQHLLKEGGSTMDWRELFYCWKSRVSDEWIGALKAWGETREMQQLQKSMARERYWKRALSDAQLLGVETARGRALLFDVAVQNGGWGSRHAWQCARLVPEPCEMDEQARLELIAQSVANAAKTKWRADVLSRKLLFGRGTGVVHGRPYCLRDFAIE